MSLLGDLFIGAITSLVDALSYVVFHLVAILLLTVVHVFQSASTVLVRVVNFALSNITNLLDDLVDFIVETVRNAFVSLLSTLVDTVLKSVNIIAESLLQMVLDLFADVRTTLNSFTELISDFLLDVSKLAGLSVSTVWENFAKAVAHFIDNL